MSETAGQPKPPRGSIWIGPFVSVPQANRAITGAGWMLVAIGVFPVLSMAEALRKGDALTIAVACGVASLFVLPGAFLLIRRSRLAAGIAVGMMLLPLGLMAVGLVSLTLQGNMDLLAPGTVAGAVMFGSAAYLCWRARAAARFLKPLKETQVFD